MDAKRQQVHPSAGHTAHYLGLVLDPAQPPPNAVERVLVSFEDKPHLFYQIRANDSRYHTSFVRRIYVAAAVAYAKLGRTGEEEGAEQCPEDVVLIGREDNRHAYLIPYFREQARRSKPRTIPPEIRNAIVRRFFKPRGVAGSTLHLVWPKLTPPGSIFFLGSHEFRQFVEPSGSYKERDPVAIPPSALGGSGALPPATIEAIALAVSDLERHSTKSQPWEELYRQALASSFAVPAFIPVEVAEWRQDEPERIGRAKPAPAVPLCKVLRAHRRILLIGPSGAGKTTTLRHLAAEVAARREDLGLTDPLPLYVRLEYLSGLMGHPGALAEVLARTVEEAIWKLPRDALERCALFRRDPPKARARYKYPGRREAARAIAERARMLLDEPEEIKQDVVLLLDGYDRTSARARRALRQALRIFFPRLNAERHCVCVVSGRPSHLPGHALAGTEIESFRAYGLRSLDMAQIEAYLSKTLGATGGRYAVRKRIAPNPALAEMARIPLFLALAAGLLRSKVVRDLPHSFPKLVQLFVQERLGEADERDESLSGTCRVSDVQVGLAAIAAEMLLKKKDFLVYPDEVPEMPRGVSVPSLLGWAERAGVLRESGATSYLPSGQGRVIFEHEAFQNHYAGLYLLGMPAARLKETMPSLVEFYGWDRAWLNFIGLNDDGGLTEGYLDELSKLDVLLAASCFRYADSVSSDWARRFLTRVFGHEGQRRFLHSGAERHARPSDPIRPRDQAATTDEDILFGLLSPFPFADLVDLLEHHPIEGIDPGIIAMEIAKRSERDALALLKRLHDQEERHGSSRTALLVGGLVPSRETLEWTAGQYVQSMETGDERLGRSALLGILLNDVALSLKEALQMARRFGKGLLPDFLDKVRILAEEDMPIVRKWARSHDQKRRIAAGKMLLANGDAGWQEAVRDLGGLLTDHELVREAMKAGAPGVEDLVLQKAEVHGFTLGGKGFVLEVLADTPSCDGFAWIAKEACAAVARFLQDDPPTYGTRRDWGAFGLKCTKVMEKWPEEKRCYDVLREAAQNEQYQDGAMLILGCLREPGEESGAAEVALQLLRRLGGEEAYPQPSRQEAWLWKGLYEQRGVPIEKQLTVLSKDVPPDFEPERDAAEGLQMRGEMLRRRHMRLLPLAIRGGCRQGAMKVLNKLPKVIELGRKYFSWWRQRQAERQPNFNAPWEAIFPVVIGEELIASLNLGTINATQCVSRLMGELVPMSKERSRIVDEVFRLMAEKVTPEEAEGIWRQVYGQWKADVAKPPEASKLSWLSEELPSLAVNVPDEAISNILKMLCSEYLEAAEGQFRDAILPLAYAVCQNTGRRHLEIFGRWPPERGLEQEALGAEPP